MVQLVSLSSFKMDNFYIFIICYYTYNIIYIHLILYKYVTKELELQNSIWFSLLKPNNDPLHFKRTYFAHFKTNVNDFCCFECVKCRTNKIILRLKDKRRMTKDLELQIVNWFY